MHGSLPLLSLCLAVHALVAAPPKALVATPPKAASHGLDLAGMDRAVAPGDDFFAYANGAWVKRTEIPADRGSFGVGHEVADLTDRRTAALIKAAAAAKAPLGSDLRKIGDCYTSFMNEKAIEAKGLTPLKPTFQAIGAIHDRKDLARYLGTTLRADVDVLNATNYHTANVLGLWVAQDLDQPDRYAPFLLQGGLGLPERSYYLDSSEGMAAVRTQYITHVAAMLKLAGLSNVLERAAAVVDLETRMAQAHAGREASGDVRKGNNHWSRADFTRKAPGLDWEAFFGAAGLARAETFVVWQPGAVTGLSTLAAHVSLDVWKDYLTFHALDHWARVLPKAVADQSFAFHGKVLSGAAKPRERWTYGVEATNQALGEAVGKAYVAKYFPPSEKARAQQMVGRIKDAFRTRIERLDWMSPATKAKAIAKLDALKVGVGYPDRWRDYRALKIVAGDAFGNAERAERFEYERNLKKLGQPIDRTEWVMTPQTVNAVNLPVMNALNFPAAILQPPYFDPRRPLAMDYGAIGAVIGHEISHSFDDSGSLFDATGKLENWWTPEDLKHFQASADQLVKQFDAYEPFPGLHINGRQTLGENIADVAGLAAAYDAYRLSQGGQEAPVVQGLTGDQQFFLSYAQSWREKTREPLLRQQILTDGHAPASFRPSTVRNLDAWYPAFQVKAGQKLYLAPADRVKIW
ncbi:M13 family metallopeptidase [Geothrix edaphica]|uniref:Peptidase M13 n=1 Tax=Geothrix edaphica TaxID=2927976 RepID=A0ABQ5PTB7_9BACT|nr:M13 family metallopeptidase [Geothrix edaphica]GLH65770.1 peptidase M13 [Geothrix edaphica]